MSHSGIRAASIALAILSLPLSHAHAQDPFDEPVDRSEVQERLREMFAPGTPHRREMDRQRSDLVASLARGPATPRSRTLVETERLAPDTAPPPSASDPVAVPVAAPLVAGPGVPTPSAAPERSSSASPSSASERTSATARTTASAERRKIRRASVERVKKKAPRKRRVVRRPAPAKTVEEAPRPGILQRIFGPPVAKEPTAPKR